MLIRKTITGDNVKSFYDSSNLMMSEYNKTTKGLTITFKNGGAYLYEDVSIKDYYRFEIADSQGVALNKTIKPLHVCKKLEGGDINLIQEEIKKIKLEELKELQLSIIYAMKNIVLDWDVSNESFDDVKLNNLLKITKTYQGKN